MTNLKENIDHYMRVKGIDNYSDLLRNIARELGMKGGEEYKFAKNKRYNFSKMLKGERPLNDEYIIPLEKIFGVSLARLLNENAYKLPSEKDNIPFDKGFRYYACLDNMELYKNEFDKLLDKEGEPIITSTDEFKKTFLDYLIEYHSINGVRYLYDTYKITFKFPFSYFYISGYKETLRVNFNNFIDFAYLVESIKDPKLFFNIFDTYYMFFSNGYYGDEKSSLYYNKEFIELILDNKELFSYLFKTIEYKETLGNIGKRNYKEDYLIHSTINPYINICLDYSLKHLEKYKKQAIEILKFAVDYNIEVASEVEMTDVYIVNDIGGLKSFKDKEFYKCIITRKEERADKDINDLKKQIVRFNKF